MRSLLNDAGFLIAVLGAVLIFVLVVLDKASISDLYLWLGGAAGPAAGRLMSRGARERRGDDP